MKKNSPLVKALLVAVVLAVLGYIGLDVPREYIEEAVDYQFQATEDENEVPVISQSYEVVSVIDGDTFEILKDGKVETVRLIGIDTPETKYSDHGEECFGEEATREAFKLLDGQKVKLESDPTQDYLDTYERLLVYAVLEDGSDYGELMIGNGFAKEYTYSKPYKNQKKYQAAEELAKNRGMGLWSCGDFPRIHPSWDTNKDGINDCEIDGTCDHTVDYTKPRF